MSWPTRTVILVRSALISVRPQSGLPRRPDRSDADQRFEVLHRRERLVEVMEEASPLLELRRKPESLGVIFETVPFHQEQVAAWSLNAPVEAERPESEALRR